MYKSVIALLFLVLAGSPARALYEYRVTGVASTDLLNVGEDPHEADSVKKAKIIGTIPWNAKVVLGTGATVRIGKTRWFQIRYRNLRGWVNGTYLKRDDGDDQDQLPSRLDCAGTEPFWSLKIGAKRAELVGPTDVVGEGSVSYSVASRRPASNRGPYMWALSLTKPGQPVPVTIVLFKSDKCSDGMSAPDYPYDAYLLLPSFDPWQGCCSLTR